VCARPEDNNFFIQIDASLVEKSYPEVSPSACLFQLQDRVPLALVFAHAEKGRVPWRGSTLMIQSEMSESVRSNREYLETRTVSEPAETEVFLEPCTWTMNTVLHLNTLNPRFPWWSLLVFDVQSQPSSLTPADARLQVIALLYHYAMARSLSQGGR